jgi:hypothetical protein
LQIIQGRWRGTPVNNPTDTSSSPTGHAFSSQVAGSVLLHETRKLYHKLDAQSLARLEYVYTADVEFRDPVHTLHGCLALRHYLRKQIANVTQYRMRYLDEVQGHNAAYLTWEMDYAHPRLNGGSMITVRGMSHLKFTDKIFYHEDSYDLGALLYEHVPLLRVPVNALKQRLGG